MQYMVVTTYSDEEGTARTAGPFGTRGDASRHMLDDWAAETRNDREAGYAVETSTNEDHTWCRLRSRGARTDTTTQWFVVEVPEP